MEQEIKFFENLMVFYLLLQKDFSVNATGIFYFYGRTKLLHL